MNRKTKIVATLGPTSSTPEIIKKLILTGVNVFRLNFSHGSDETHIKNARAIREIEKEMDIPLAIMMDLQGPKIRIGMFEDGSVSLKSGSKFSLDMEKEFGNIKRVCLPHPEIFNSLKADTILLLDDGKIKLNVINNNGRVIETEVLEGGMLLNRKGLNIPNIKLPIMALTEKDKKDIKLIDDIGADWIAISFVQTAEDISYARNYIDRDVGILAKIEKPLAVENIDSILKESDAIMVARGDLGVEFPYESIPMIQKNLIEKARESRKPVIVATQMLESMISCHVPTRAEVSDVAIAVAQGADAVMLSAESASGNYPEKAVKAMDVIVRQTESDGLTFYDKSQWNMTGMTRALSAIVEADDIRTIAAFTESGRCAINVSNSRTAANIVAFTPNVKTYRRLCLVWGIRGIIVDEIFSFSQMTQLVQRNLGKYCDIEDSEKIAIVAGIPFRASGQTNILHICQMDKSLLKEDEALDPIQILRQ
jgi:pyruvate kinase